MNNTNDNEFNIELSNAFYHVMTNPNYAKRGLRIYRVLFFSYLFGCINSQCLFHIFPEDDQTIYDNIYTSYSNYLNYLYRQHYFDKDTQYFYFVTSSGTELLYSHLISRFCFAKTEFLNKPRLIKQHKKHAVYNGIAVLKYQIMKFSSVLIETPVSNDRSSYDLSVMPVPDATIFCKDDNRIIFLETDCSTERRNTVLLPKFTNYVNYLKSLDSINHTIHLSISTNNIDISIIHKLSSLICTLRELYDFCKNVGNSKIDFSDFMNSLQISKENYRFLNMLYLDDLFKDFENSFLNDDCSSVSNIILKSMFQNTYFTRKKYIIETCKMISDFDMLFLNGFRLITMPISLNIYSYYFSLYNIDFNIKILKYILSKMLIKYSNISFKNIYTFSSLYNEFSYTFCNVFSIDFDEIMYYFSLENVSDDLGAIYRCKQYISNYNNYPLTNFFLICIYNDLEGCELRDYYITRYPHCDSIYFIPYSEILQLL